jgi:hypothetical protein
MVSPIQDLSLLKHEYAPVRYDLADDPEHARLREVNEQDIERLEDLLEDNYHYCELLVTWKQAYQWKERNLVSDPHPEICASDADGTPGTGFAFVQARHAECFICRPVHWPPQTWNAMVRSGFFDETGQHCEAHAAAYHASVPTTWHCCDPPYDPARAYAWREQDPWLDRRED